MYRNRPIISSLIAFEIQPKMIFEGYSMEKKIKNLLTFLCFAP